jgi:translocation and assembly module TamB
MPTLGRRQLIVLLSALAMVLLGGGVVGALVAATQSEGGRDWIRSQVAREANRGLRGHFYIGRLSGSFITDITIDSLALRDREDSLYISSGKLTLRYDARDLVNGRFIFRAVEVEHPLMITRRELDDVWNFRKIFPVEEHPLPSPHLPRGSFGSLIVLNNIRIRGGEVQLTKPWQPDDSLSGARRDSAIAFGLADSSREIRRVTKNGRRGFQRTWRWADIDGEITRLRFRHPDSTGRQFEIARLAVNETDPPFKISGLQGTALWRGDTVWMDAPKFSLPGSVGAMQGKVEWPTGDTFWDINLQSDSTALADIHWIYPTLPVAGYGRMKLRVKSRANPDILDYVITEMDVKSEGSRLRGAMTYGVGGPVLEVRDVALSLEPADFKLLETLNGVPFPYPWRGAITGTVQASGGPVTNFMVEKADLAFTDRNVPGATAKGVGRGEVDILFPGFMKFHAFKIDLDHFDLRTGQFLNPLFPRLNGFVSGTATLDSMWMDVRLSDADLVHRDGDDVAASRFRGSARVTTLDENFVSFDASMAATPLSAAALAKSYPMIPLRGEYSGTIRALGTIADLSFSTDLVGDAGRVQVDGRFDGYEPGYGAIARGTLTGFDFSKGLAWKAAPPSLFDGRFSVDLTGDSLSNLRGTAQLIGERSVVDGVRYFGARSFLTFGGGLMRVDSATVEGVPGLLTARGALGLVSGRTDTLRFQFVGDSLGGLRRYLGRAADTLVADSLAGSLRASGVLSGSVQRFALDASVDGSGMLLRTMSARQVRGSVALSSLPDSATGALTLRFDRLGLGTLSYDDVDLRADVTRGLYARTSASLTASSGSRIGAVADVRRRGDTTVVRLDSLGATTSANVWNLVRPATVMRTRGGFGLDTLVMTGAKGGRINIAGRTASLDTVSIGLRAEQIPLADVGELLQTREPMAGRATLRADVRGTSVRPDIFFTGSMTAAEVGGFRFDQMAADGRYADRRLTTSVALARGGLPTLHADASLPIDLAFEPGGSRFPDDPLTAHIRSDSAGLDLLEAFIPSMRDSRGALRVDVDVSGTWRKPRATGSLAITAGSFSMIPMGLARVEALEADIGFLGDSIALRRFTARTADRASSASLTGGLSIRDATDGSFGLSLDLQRFNILNDPRVADLDLTGNLSLTGRRSAAVLRGGFTVDRGEIRLPELYQKRVISLDDYRVVDTSALVDRPLVATGDTVFMNNLSVQNVTIRMGSDVWLRSEEANIGLGGFVSVTRERSQRGGGAGRSQLVVEGPLQTTRGTYRLNLGPVQRPFAVQSGEVRFYGDPDFNATLDIDAQHVVRQISQQSARPDVRVNVHIGGTRLAPTAELSTPDSVRVTTADLISYLTTGGPSTEISGRDNDYTSTLTRAVLTSWGSFLGTKVSAGLCDDAQFSSAGLDAYEGRLRTAGRVLQGTRFNCAKQLSDRLFVRLDAGLCGVGKLVDPGSQSTNFALQDAFGAKFDYRLAREYTLSLGVEPPSSAVYCREVESARGFVPTPRQLGFDLVRLWRF